MNCWGRPAAMPNLVKGTTIDTFRCCKSFKERALLLSLRKSQEVVSFKRIITSSGHWPHWVGNSFRILSITYFYLFIFLLSYNSLSVPISHLFRNVSKIVISFFNHLSESPSDASLLSAFRSGWGLKHDKVTWTLNFSAAVELLLANALTTQVHPVPVPLSSRRGSNNKTTRHVVVQSHDSRYPLL